MQSYIRTPLCKINHCTISRRNSSLSEPVVVVLVDAVVEELAGEGEEEVEGDEDEEEHREEHPRLHVDPQGDLLRFGGLGVER